jgi:hypothetical protein
MVTHCLQKTWPQRFKTKSQLLKLELIKNLPTTFAPLTSDFKHEGQIFSVDLDSELDGLPKVMLTSFFKLFQWLVVDQDLCETSYFTSWGGSAA